MAKISLTFDTVTKEFNITLDGVSLPDVKNVYFGNYYDNEPAYIEVEMVSKVESEDIRVSTRILASQVDKVSPDREGEIIPIDEYGLVHNKNSMASVFAMLGKQPPK